MIIVKKDNEGVILEAQLSATIIPDGFEEITHQQWQAIIEQANA